MSIWRAFNFFFSGGGLKEDTVLWHSALMDGDGSFAEKGWDWDGEAGAAVSSETDSWEVPRSRAARDTTMYTRLSRSRTAAG